MSNYLMQDVVQVQRFNTGIVIPVYFPADVDPDTGANLLRDTVHSYAALVDDPSNVCLSVDGAAQGWDIALSIAKECGTHVVCSQENKGKLNGVRNGVAALWEREALAYFVEVDSDGDHFANELLNLLRAALLYCQFVS